MQALTDTLLPIVNTINGYLSDYILVFLLMGAGLYFSFKTKFVQVRCFGEGMKRVFGNLTLSGKKHESGMSSFQALATAIAAQVGTGNIVGASGAILTGGPGAIFWMWIIAFFGMATIYAEAVLAQKTRVKNEDGQYLGGPVYYIRTAFQGALENSWQPSSPLPSSWLWALPAVWYSPTPSALLSAQPLVFRPGSLVSF